QQVGSVTADTFGSDFHSLDDALRVNDEGTAVGQALVFTQDLEVAADLHGRVADHGVLDLADGFGAVVPRLGGGVGGGGRGVDFDAQRLQRFVVVGNVAQLGGADEGAGGGVEGEYGPLALHVGAGNGDEFAVFERLGGKRVDFSS